MIEQVAGAGASPEASYCLQECSPACANQEGARKINHPKGWEIVILLHVASPYFPGSPKGAEHRLRLTACLVH